MDWYKDDVEAAINEREKCPYEPKTIFYGSSSIRLWNSLYDDFKNFKPVNLGFGGSTLAACVWFFDHLVAPIRNPDKFILYAGDNDLGDGRHPEEVLIFFHDFMLKLREHFPDVPFYYISIKPSLSRMEIINEIMYANNLIEKDIQSRAGKNHFINIYNRMINGNGKPIETLFGEDGLHLSKEGYSIWKEVLLKECFSNE